MTGESQHLIIQPEKKACTCKQGKHVVIGPVWVTDDIEAVKLYCTECNAVWHEV